MLVKLQLRKTALSSWLLGIFLLILIVSASVSQFFQNPTYITHDFYQYKFLFDKNELKTINGITIKNRLTNVVLQKSSNGKNWNMLSPRELPAKSETILKVTSMLEALKIKEVHTLDPINMSHYSLNNPITEVTFSFDKSSNIIMKFGLINPIGNTTYVVLSDKEAIYHVEAPKTPLESLSLADFIESKVFPFKTQSINSLTIFRGDNKKKQIQLQMKQGKEGWIFNNKRKADENRINEYLLMLSNMKSNIILDTIEEKQEESIKKYLDNPMHTVVIDHNNEKITYKISNIVYSIPGLKIGKRQHFLVYPSNRNYIFVVDKLYLTAFSIRQKDLNSISIKKLFY